MKSRIERYGQLTTSSRDMLKYIRELSEDQQRYKKVAAKMEGCASMMVFHDYYTVGEQKLVKTYTCQKHLLCNFCAARRAAKSIQLNLPKVTQVLESSPGLIPVMITLTLKRGEDLAERYQLLDHSLKRLVQKRRNARKASARTKSEFAKVEAAAMSTEITLNWLKGGWGPHVHMMALASDYLDVHQLSSEWEELTGDSMIVDVRKIKPREGSIEKALLEVFKYALKFSDLDPVDRVYASDSLQGKRLVRTLGSFRGLVMPEKLVDDPLEDLPYLEKVYQYTKKGYDLRHIQEHESSSGECSHEQQSVTGSAPTPPATSTNDIRGVENEPSNSTRAEVNTSNRAYYYGQSRITRFHYKGRRRPSIRLSRSPLNMRGQDHKSALRLARTGDLPSGLGVLLRGGSLLLSDDRMAELRSRLAELSRSEMSAYKERKDREQRECSSDP